MYRDNPLPGQLEVLIRVNYPIFFILCLHKCTEILFSERIQILWLPPLSRNNIVESLNQFI